MPNLKSKVPSKVLINYIKKKKKKKKVHFKKQGFNGKKMILINCT